MLPSSSGVARRDSERVGEGAFDRLKVELVHAFVMPGSPVVQWRRLSNGDIETIPHERPHPLDRFREDFGL
jgi:hypothetical protein